MYKTFLLHDLQGHRAGKFRSKGKHNGKKARPILIKFLSHKSKEGVMKSKREFKGTYNRIADDLSNINMEKVKLLHELRKASNIKNV